MMKKMCAGCHWAGKLLVLGGLNYGLMGLAGVNLFEKLLGGVSFLEHLVYIVLGLAAVIKIMSIHGKCKMCNKMHDCEGGKCGNGNCAGGKCGPREDAAPAEEASGDDDHDHHEEGHDHEGEGHDHGDTEEDHL